MVVDPLKGFADQRTWVGYDNANGSEPGSAFLGRVNQPATGPERPGTIDPYLKSAALKRCPNKPARSQTAWAFNGWNPGLGSSYYATHPEAQNREYGPASKTFRLVNGLAEYDGVSDSEIDRPAETLILMEHDAGAPLCNFLMPYDWTTVPPEIESLKSHFNFLHTSGTNTLWADGHVRRMVYGGLRRAHFTVVKGD